MLFLRLFYEVFIILAVVTYAIIIFANPTDHPNLTPEVIQRIDWGLIIFFAVEYLIRLWFSSPNELRFMRQNWFDLVAMLPIDSHFALARLVRVVRLVRILKSSPLLWSIITSKQMRTLFFFLGVVLFWSAGVIYFLEAGSNASINSYEDALWWAIVTTTTVGYGDISPVTQGGRLIAMFLMLTSIALIGTFTATIANHWLTIFNLKDQKKQTTSPANAAELLEQMLLHEDRLQTHLKHDAIRALSKIESLTDQEYEKLLKVIDLLRHQKDVTEMEEIKK